MIFIKEENESINYKISIQELLDSKSLNHIYLTSDWHMYSIKYKKEKNPVNVNNIVKWCKDNIKEDDVFIYLGDMCYRWATDEDNEKVQKLFKSLPGIKILVLGNHDIIAGEQFYTNCGFDYIVNEFTWNKYIFTHKPVNVDMMVGIDKNIHGHIHKWAEYNTTDGLNNINVYPSYYDNKCPTLDYIITHADQLIKDMGNKRSNWINMSESSNIFGNIKFI